MDFFDERILGGRDFVDSLLSGREEKAGRYCDVKRSSYDLDQAGKMGHPLPLQNNNASYDIIKP
jgi:hypothetical protein